MRRKLTNDIIGVGIVALITALLDKLVSPLFKPRADRDPTGLDELAKLPATSKVLPDVSLSGNISETYEKMCVMEPSKYRTDPRVRAVMDEYTRLLNGEIPDPDGKHVPSEIIFGEPNPDYRKYLLAQKKACGLPWIEEELKRFSNVRSTAKVISGYVDALMERGLSRKLAVSAVTDERINTFSADDWKNIADALNQASNDTDEDALIAYVESVQDKGTLFNSECATLFGIYHAQGINDNICALIARGRITTDQIKDAAEWIEAYPEVSFEKALQWVLEPEQKRSKDSELRRKYHIRIKRG